MKEQSTGIDSGVETLARVMEGDFPGRAESHKKCEFSDALSDDLDMLDKMREALINDPLRPGLPVYVNASACRFLIVLTVTSIEGFLKTWRGRSEAIDDYFIEVGENGEKVKNVGKGGPFL